MSQPTCAHCNTAFTNLKVRGRCRQASYCNKVCQKADWKLHKAACHGISQEGDAVSFSIETKNPNQPRAFPTFAQQYDECETSGEAMIIPRECYTEQRMPNGHIMMRVSEEKYQEWQKREADAKAASVSQTKENTTEGEGGKGGRSE